MASNRIICSASTNGAGNHRWTQDVLATKRTLSSWAAGQADRRWRRWSRCEDTASSCWKKRNSRAGRSASRCCRPRCTASAALPASPMNWPKPDSPRSAAALNDGAPIPKPWTFAFSVSPKMTGETSYAYQVERSKFDQILLDHARHMGVDVREEHAVTGVIEDGDRVRGVSYTDAKGNAGTIRATVRGGRLGQQEPHLPAGRGDTAVLGVLPQPRALRLLRGRQAPARAQLRQHPVLRLRQRLVLVHTAAPHADQRRRGRAARRSPARSRATPKRP